MILSDMLKKDEITVSAHDLVKSACDTVLDCAMDEQEDIKTIENIQARMNHIQDMAVDMLEGVIEEFRERMIQEIRTWGAEVDTIKLSKKGFEDAEYTLKRIA